MEETRKEDGFTVNELACLNCGKGFIPTCHITRQKFCSSECRVRYNNAKRYYLPSLHNTAATSDNPLTAYRAEEMIGLLETTGRVEEFDFSLMIRTLDRVEIMPTEKLSFIFQSGIRITV